MKTRVRPSPHAGSAALLVVALSLGLAACDSRDDGDGARTSSEVSVASEKQAIQDVYRGIRAAVAAQDGEAACAAMSEQLQRTAAANFTSDEGASCAEAIEMEILSSRLAGTGRIVDVQASGDTAVARTRLNGFGQSEMRFTKEGDTWKLDR